MGELLTYSGSSTKRRAWNSRLLTDNDYRNMAGMTSVSDAILYLKKTPGYGHLLADQDETALHRNEIETLLIRSVYRDYQKLYRFSSTYQRKFLEAYFGRYETAMLKDCMRLVFDHQEATFYTGSFREFFDKHSDIDLEKLSGSHTIGELVENLKGTMYYDCLHRLSDKPSATLWDYGMTLDLFYFTWLWNQREAVLKDKDSQRIFMDAYGVKIDLLNLQWICRSKKYFHMTAAQIYAMIIPVQYHLKKDDIQALAESENMETFEQLLQKTWYGRHFENVTSEKLPQAYVHIRHKIQTSNAKKEPYSAATVISYLFEKEHEIDQVTTVLEGIRYGLPQDEILSYI